MKITFIVDHVNLGGAERVIANLSNSFIHLDNKVTIITMKELNSIYMFDENIVFYHIHLNRSIFRGVNMIKKILLIRKKIKLVKPDIVISFLTQVNIISIISCYRIQKLIVSERNNPLISPGQKTYRFLRKVLYPIADGFVFQNQFQKKYFNPKIQEKSVIIENPITPHKISKNNYSASQTFCFVSVGKLEKQKNHEFSITLIKKLINEGYKIRLDIYGEGTLSEKLIEQINKLELQKNIKLLGISQDIFRALVKYDAFLFSSNFEGTPNIILEAQSVGMPIITSEFEGGSINELICQKVNGLIFKLNDISDATDKAIQLIENEDLRKKIGVNARYKVAKYDINSISSEWINYINLVKGKNE